MERYTMRLPDDLGAVPVSGYGTPEIIDRLAAYEDTGLEPEEVESMMSMREISPETEYAIDKHASSIIEKLDALLSREDNSDHVKDLLNAESEGRLLVLPCKVGGDLWVNDRDGKPRRMVLDAPDIRCHCAKEDNLCIALCDSPKDGVCAYRLKNDGTDFGQKIFRTREEAEAALEEREDNASVETL